MTNEPPKEPVKYVDATLHLPYHYVAGDSRARYLHALKEKTILGSKCAKTGKVFVPPLVCSPESFAPIEIPYVAASIALDGADVSIYALIQECAPDQVRMGMRVEAVWKPDGERQGDHEDIMHFRPTGEPDVPLESVLHRL